MNFDEYVKLQEEGSAWTGEHVTYQNLLSDAIYTLVATLGEENKHLKILDIGGGDGWGASRLMELGFTNVTVGDISKPKIEVARKAGVDAVVMDMHDITGEWDVIFCSHTLEHSLDIKKALISMAGALKPGGLLFLIVPIEREDPRDANPSHTQWVSDPSLIVNILEKKLKLLAHFEKERGVLEHWSLWQR